MQDVLQHVCIPTCCSLRIHYKSTPKKEIWVSLPTTSQARKHIRTRKHLDKYRKMYLHANLYTHSNTFTGALHAKRSIACTQVCCTYKPNTRRFQVHENIYIQIYKLIYLCMNIYIYMHIYM